MPNQGELGKEAILDHELRPPQNVPSPTGEETFAHVFVNAYGQSDTGLIRRSNQDQFLIAVLNRQLEVFQSSLGDGNGRDLDEPAEHGWVFLVADGIGGHASGEEASAITARASLSYLQSTMPWFATVGPDQLERAEEVLRSVVHRTHETVLKADRKQREGGMGSTLTLAYVLWPHLFVVHTGDSRCYLFREGSILQLTRDHPLAQEQNQTEGVDAKVLANSKHAEHILTRAVGAGRKEPPEPAVNRWELQDRDTLLLCSDGLTSMVSDQGIQKLLSRETFANARCQALIEAANAAGGTDNTTAVVASFEDFGSRADPC